MLLQIISAILLNQPANGAVQPIKDVELYQENGNIYLEAEVLLNTPCYFFDKGSAVVKPHENEITIRQTASSDSATCIQVMTPKLVTYNLGDVPEGEYSIVDRYDKTVVDEIVVDDEGVKSKKTMKPVE